MSEYINQHSLKHCGRIPVVLAPLLLYSNDTSGNKSKKWNKFDAFCVTLACLPKFEARKIQNIHFVTCSNQLHVSAIELSRPIVDDLLKLERGVQMFDAHLKTNVLVIAPLICAPCDNVRSAELVNHLGSKVVRLCRLCMVSIRCI